MSDSCRAIAARSRRIVVAAFVALVAGVVAVPGRASAATPSAGYHPIAPIRIYDSRDGLGVTPANGSALGDVVVTVAGVANVPTDATRAALRVTVTGLQSTGDVYVHPCGAFNASGLVLLRAYAGETASQLAFATLVGGAACISMSGAMQVIVDVEGYESPAAGGAAYVAIPHRPIATKVAVAAGGTTPLSVLPVGVPAGAVAVSGILTARSTTSGYLTAFPCDSARPNASTALVEPRTGEDSVALASPVSAAGQICVFSQSGAEIDVEIYGYWAVGATATSLGPVQLGFRPFDAPRLVAVTPSRLFDTRSRFAPVVGGTVFDLDLTAVVPRTATDVVLNATVTDPRAAGYVTVYPCDAERPTASNLNFVAGQTVPNLVTVSLGAAGHVCFYASVTTELLADLSGWYDLADGSGFEPAEPSRLFDTRGGARVGAGAVYELTLDDRVPADATAIVMNVTATEATAAGFVTVYPCSAARPTASNLNVRAGVTAPNLVTVAVGADRRVCFFASAPTHLLADLAGSYTSSSVVGFFGVTPVRWMDTRDAPPRPVGAGETVALRFGPGVVGTPDPVVAVVLNLTAVEPAAAGFVTAYPCAAGRPNASNVNYVAHQVVPNLAVVSVDDADRVCFYTQQTAHLVADLAGIFSDFPMLFRVLVT